MVLHNKNAALTCRIKIHIFIHESSLSTIYQVTQLCRYLFAIDLRLTANNANYCWILITNSMQALQLLDSVSKANHLRLHSCISEPVWPAGSRGVREGCCIHHHHMNHLPFPWMKRKSSMYRGLTCLLASTSEVFVF